MTQPPVTPGPQPPQWQQPYSGPPASPAPYGPQPYGQPAYGPPGWPVQPIPPKKTSNRKILLIVGLVIGLLVLLSLVFGTAGGVSDRDSASDLDVSVTSCEFVGGALSSATVGIKVKNNGDSTRTVRVKVEYRDSAGVRVDTDTAVVRGIKPGDTARVEETTILDAEITSGTCAAVSVD